MGDRKNCYQLKIDLYNAANIYTKAKVESGIVVSFSPHKRKVRRKNKTLYYRNNQVIS